MQKEFGEYLRNMQKEFGESRRKQQAGWDKHWPDQDSKEDEAAALLQMWLDQPGEIYW